MLLKEPIVNAIIIFVISKTAILSAVLAYYSFFVRKSRRPKGKAAPDPRRTAAPRLVLTLKEGNKTGGAGREARTALQHTIEETFSSN
jgi:hypothetical protein